MSGEHAGTEIIELYDYLYVLATCNQILKTCMPGIPMQNKRGKNTKKIKEQMSERMAQEYMEW